jgi:hypothetical protein
MSRSHTRTPAPHSCMAASVHVKHWRVSTRQYPQPYGHGKASRSNERPSIELKISGSGPKILNAVVADSASLPLYSISSDESHTTLLLQRDCTKVATIDWDRSSPRMAFRGKKVKCKEWLPRAGPDTEYVLLFLPHSSLLTEHESGLVCSRTAIRSSSGWSNPIVAS